MSAYFSGLYGKTNIDMFQIDEVVGLAEDLRDFFVKIYHEKDEQKKVGAISEFQMCRIFGCVH